MKRDLYERHQPETHFIPRAVAAALQGEAIRLNGSDYATRDGTCERDYVHVDDLATAHLSAVNLLREGQRSDKINLGIGRGYTLLEVVAAIKATTGLELNVEFAPRRPGDPPALVADPSKAAKILAWSPQYTQIEAIVATVVAAARRQRVANDGKADILVT
jgi:UDP-glucose 4-epimerase